MIQFGNFISDKQDEELILVMYPHKYPINRLLRKESKGRYLGPHCIRRFLPSVAYVDSSVYPKYLIGNLGDIVRPRIYYEEHKYKNVQKYYSFEELLDLTKKILKEKIFEQQKKLLFFGVSFDLFSIQFESYFQKEKKDEQYLFVIISPFLYLETHYENLNIRTDSCIRYLQEFLDKNKISKQCKIMYIGTEQNLITKNEKEFIEKHDYDIIYDKEVENNFDSILDKINEYKEYKKFIGFSFNCVENQYFQGKNQPSTYGFLNNENSLKLFRKLGQIESEAFSVFDFNPQKEDFISGTFANLKNSKKSIK